MCKTKPTVEISPLAATHTVYVSPIVANLFMEDFDCRAVTVVTYPRPPQFWGRYVDDVLCFIQKCKIDKDSLINDIN